MMGESIQLTLLKFLSYFLRITLELLSRFIFAIKYWGVERQVIPPISNLILTESATSLAQKIRSKKVSSESVIRSFISRIKEVNPIVNAVVDTRFDEALEEAKSVDQFIRSASFNSSEIEASRPFLGVPFTVKDCFSVIGLKQTAGLLARKDIIPDEDADNVRLMKEAGAIIMAVTNVSELCMWWESSNKIYGRTSNAYDTTKIVGGSSGGEGCLQSVCGSPMGVGSDIGGSIRMPCFFNGIFGHKPTSGIVSNHGEEPLAVGALQDYLVTGPMCKFACDLLPMYKVLASSNVHLLSLDKQVNFRNLKIYYMEDDGGNPGVTPVDTEMKTALHKVLDHFKQAYKVVPIKVNIKYIYESGRMYFAKLGDEKAAVSFASEMNMKKGEINVWLEFLKSCLGFGVHTFPALFLAIMEKFNRFNTDNRELHDYCDKLKAEMKSMLGEDAIFLYPSHPTTAPYHSQPLFRPFNFVYTAIWNIVGLPITQCPLGLSSKGLPLGVQVMANHYQDHLTLAVAREIEKAFGGWVNPSQVL